MSVRDRMTRLLHEMPHLQFTGLSQPIYVDLRIERYPLPKGEKDALLHSFLKRGLVAHHSRWGRIYISPDGEVMPSTEKQRRELMSLPDDWEQYIVVETAD